MIFSWWDKREEFLAVPLQHRFSFYSTTPVSFLQFLKNCSYLEDTSADLMADVIYGEGVQLVLAQNIKILAQFTAFKTPVALYA